MASPHPASSRYAQARRAASCLCLLGCSACAQASWLRGCALGEPAFQCRLDAILHTLYVVAAVLLLLLTGVVAVAFYLYRKHKSDGSLID